MTGCFHQGYARLFPLCTDNDTAVGFRCYRNKHTGCFCPNSNWILCSPHGKSNKRAILFLDELSVFILFRCWSPKSSTERATRISFMNDIANLCELVGADVNMVRSGIGSDTRIGRKFLYPGIGYGGSCFPKDVKALIKTAEQNGYRMRVLQAVEEVNEKQKSILFEKLQRHFNGDLRDKTIALWGLAFKPETDDMREAPSLILIDKLLNAGCKVRVYDPAAMTECRRRIGDSVCYATDMYDAALDADALMLVTEWKEFRLPSWAVIKKAMRTPVLLDGRNIYEKKEIEELGFTYHCIGK
nr:MAG TPA: putative UDP-glucose 6-dehydrogenase [Bacteriophage sp.]